ncbi:MAG: helix-turn-helix transcriptional regulator [Candidatus Nanopelagicales bacterium]
MPDETEKSFYRTLGANVRSRRRALGMSQSALADCLDLTRVSITNLEAGRQRPLAHQVAQLAAQLNTTVEDLVPMYDVPDYDADRARDNAAIEAVWAAAHAQTS